MEKILDWLDPAKLFSINSVSFVLTVVSFFLAIIFYIRSQKRRVPTYTLRNVNLIREKAETISEISIRYRGEKVDNLSICQVALWNAGEETINFSDIAPSDRLKIVSQGEENFLEVKIIFEKNPANNFILEVTPTNSPKELFINFDYFDINEGIILQVFHTGKNSDNIKIVGSVKGAGQVQKLNTPLFMRFLRSLSFLEKMNKRYKKRVIAVMLAVTPFFFIFAEYSKKNIPNENESLFFKYLPIFLLALVYWFMAYFLIHRRVPRGFELFEEEIEVNNVEK